MTTSVQSKQLQSQQNDVNF